MTYFAIHVKSGCERLVANHISNYCRNQRLTDINSVIVPTRTTIDLTTEKITKKIKTKFESYIFISVDSESMDDIQMDARLYQLVRNASPFILRILPHSLEKNEYEQFLDSESVTEVEVVTSLSPELENEEKIPSQHYAKLSSLNETATRKRLAYIKYLQHIYSGIKKKISIRFDNEKLILCANSLTLMELFKGTTMTIVDLIKRPLVTLVKVAMDYD